MTACRLATSAEEVPPPPRTVPPGALLGMKAGSFWGALITGATGLVFAGIFCAIDGAWPPLPDLRLDYSAATTSGRVVGTRLTGTKVNNRSVTALSFTYTVGGKGYRAECMTTAGSWARRLKNKGGPVTVEYLPAAPRTARVKGATAGLLPSALYLIPGGALLLAFLLIWLGWRSAAANWRLLRRGTVAVGTVVSAKANTFVRVQRRGGVVDHPVTVVYEFKEALRGEKLEGHFSAYTSQLDPPEEGTALAVVYDPQKPSRNVPYLLFE